MNIFEKRSLCLILSIMLGVFSLFVLSGTLERLIVIGIALILFLITLIFPDIFLGRNNVVRISSLGAIVAIILGCLLETAIMPPDLLGERVHIEGQVTEVKNTTSHSRNITLISENIDNKERELVFIITTYDYDMITVAPGDYISLNATVELPSGSEKGLSSSSYYLSRGYSYRLTDVSDEFLISHTGLDFDLIKEFRSRLSEKLIDLTDPSTGGLLAALILGNQDYLDPNTKLSFSLIGITHILALSGAHLVMLSEALKRICQLFGLNKKTVYVLTTLFSILYTILTGCSPSIVRAMVMLIVNNTLFLLSRTHDSFTTIPVAVALILIFDPRSVFDLGLWLSAFATLGLIFYSDLQSGRPAPETIPQKIGIFLKDSILSTFFAIGATLFITVFSFDYISVLSPVTTLLFNFPITLIIYGGVIMLFIPFQTPLSIPVAYLTDLVRLAADKISSIKWAIVSTDFVSVEVLTVVFTFAFFFLLIFNTKARRFIALALSVLLTLPFILGMIETGIARSDEAFEFSYRETADVVSFSSPNEVTIIYNGETGVENAYLETGKLDESNRVFVDKLIITCYNKTLSDYVYHFISLIKTDIVYLPKPCTDAELEISTEISSTLSRFSTSIHFYDIDEEIKIGDAIFSMKARYCFGGNNAAQAIYDLIIDGKQYTYFSLGAMKLLGYEASDLFMRSSCVIFGGYGGEYNENVIIDIFSETITEIYISEKVSIVSAAYDYYAKKEVPIESIGTSF